MSSHPSLVADVIDSAISRKKRQGLPLSDIVDEEEAWIEDPVPFRDFVESDEHLGLPPLSEKQYGCIYKVLGDDPKKVFSPERTVDYGVWVWGKGSGKDYCCSIVQAYVAYILLELKDPQGYFLFGKKENLDVLNIARKGTQAQQIYFEKFKARLEGWRWLQENFTIIESGTPRNTKGKPVIYVGKTGVKFPNHIRAYSETSNNEAFEGYSPVFYVCDEISAFVGPTGKQNATKIFSTLRTSVTSRSTKRFKGLGMLLSYPRADDDLILEEYERSQEHESIAGDLAVPWEVKPAYLFSGELFDFEDHSGKILKIPVEYKREFDLNPEDACCKFLCRPRRVGSAYFDFPERINEIVIGEAPLLETRQILVQDQFGRKFVGLRIVAWNEQRLLEDRGAKYIVTVDGAKSSCNAVLSLGHLEFVPSPVPVASPGAVAKLVIDAVLVWTPDMQREHQISLDNMEEVFIAISQKVPVVAGSLDQWSSAQTIERLRRRGLLIEEHNVTLVDYEELKTLIYMSLFEVCSSAGAVLGAIELRKLVEGGGHRKPQKPAGGSQDVVDTWGGQAYWFRRLMSDKKLGMQVSARSPGPGVGVTSGRWPAATVFTTSQRALKASTFTEKDIGRNERVLRQLGQAVEQALVPGQGAGRFNSRSAMPPVGVTKSGGATRIPKEGR